MTQKLNINGKNPDLSEMHLAVFTFNNPIKKYSFTPDKKSGILGNYGNSFRAIAMLSRLAGPVNESSLRYNSNIQYSDKKALLKKLPEDFRRTMRLRDAYFLSVNNDPGPDVRKDLIMKHGAIVVSMYSDPFKYYRKENFYTYFNNDHGSEVNHIVALAGWDDNFPRERFSPVPKRNGAWLVKNSWGSLGSSKGAHDGYFWMSYEQTTFEGTAFIVEKYNSRLRHYGYDDLGWCKTVNYSWAANVFQANKDETLIEAAFYTPSNNLKYEAYTYKHGSKFPASPTAGELVENFNGEIKYSGYHTVTLPNRFSLREGEYFSVVLKLAGGDFPVESAVKNFSDNAAVHKHESYFSRDGRNWTDGININANACIKAFTLE